MTLQKSNF